MALGAGAMWWRRAMGSPTVEVTTIPAAAVTVAEAATSTITAAFTLAEAAAPHSVPTSRAGRAPRSPPPSRPLLCEQSTRTHPRSNDKFLRG